VVRFDDVLGVFVTQEKFKEHLPAIDVQGKFIASNDLRLERARRL
jgi:hypothetical protein